MSSSVLSMSKWLFGINTDDILIIYSLFYIHFVNNLLLDQIILSILSFEIFFGYIVVFCSFFFSDLFAAAFKMLQLILFNSVTTAPHTYFLSNARGNASRAPYKWSLSPISLFSGHIISLKLDNRVRRRQYMLRLRIWSPRVIALSPDTPAKRRPSILPFYGRVKCVESHNSAVEAYKNIDRARSGAAASAKESSKNYRVRIPLLTYNSHTILRILWIEKCSALDPPNVD